MSGRKYHVEILQWCFFFIILYKLTKKTSQEAKKDNGIKEIVSGYLA
jgi:hypothetical protein